MTCSNKRRNKPLIELVHSFQVHVVGQPHVLIYEVQSGMSYELVQMTVIILDDNVSSTRLTFPDSIMNTDISFWKFYTQSSWGWGTSDFTSFITVMGLRKDLKCFHIIFFSICYLKLNS